MGQWIALLEMLGIFGIVIGWCLWELYKLKRDRPSDENKAQDAD